MTIPAALKQTIDIEITAFWGRKFNYSGGGHNVRFLLALILSTATMMGQPAPKTVALMWSYQISDISIT